VRGGRPKFQMLSCCNLPLALHVICSRQQSHLPGCGRPKSEGAQFFPSGRHRAPSNKLPPMADSLEPNALAMRLAEHWTAPAQVLNEGTTQRIEIETRPDPIDGKFDLPALASAPQLAFFRRGCACCCMREPQGNAGPRARCRSAATSPRPPSPVTHCPFSSTRQRLSAPATATLVVPLRSHVFARPTTLRQVF